jgi:glycosylphosphatidylinositol deacylase
MVAGSLVHASEACPSTISWSDDGFERDIYIQTTTVTVLAMDGRRRWLDIQKLVSFSRALIVS